MLKILTSDIDSDADIVETWLKNNRDKIPFPPAVNAAMRAVSLKAIYATNEIDRSTR